MQNLNKKVTHNQGAGAGALNNLLYGKHLDSCEIGLKCEIGLNVSRHINMTSSNTVGGLQQNSNQSTGTATTASALCVNEGGRTNSGSLGIFD